MSRRNGDRAGNSRPVAAVIGGNLKGVGECCIGADDAGDIGQDGGKAHAAGRGLVDADGKNSEVAWAFSGARAGNADGWTVIVGSGDIGNAGVVIGGEDIALPFVIDRANASGCAGVADCGGRQAERFVAFVNSVIGDSNTDKKLATGWYGNGCGIGNPAGSVEILKRVANVGTHRGFGVQCCQPNRVAQSQCYRNAGRTADGKGGKRRGFVDENAVDGDGVLRTLNRDVEDTNIGQPTCARSVHDGVVETVRQGSAAWGQRADCSVVVVNNIRPGAIGCKP